jgi:glycosyltransferase involved in cell wall biosynthesis
MKILHVTPAFAPAYVYGGPIVSVTELCDRLAESGHDLCVLTTDANGPGRVLAGVRTDAEMLRESGARVRYCHRVMRSATSPRLVRELHRYVSWADVVHLTAVYNFTTIPTLVAARLLGRPVVWSPRGGLQRWPGVRRRMAKRVWELACRAVASDRVILHCTSEEEAYESRVRLPRCGHVVIPNGVTPPAEVRYVPAPATLRLLYLGRLDPKKGVENLLSACQIWHRTSPRPWTLTIAGGGESSYVAQLRQRVFDCGLQDRVTLLGAVAHDELEGLFARSDLLVVPSHSENFAMVIAEALAHAVPVIASRGTPWKRVEEVGCGLWVENSPVGLAGALERMACRDRRHMGAAGRAWIEREFSWSGIARKMLDVYDAAAGADRACWPSPLGVGTV